MFFCAHKEQKKRQGRNTMVKKVYVGNLPFSVKQQDLVQMFSAYGDVAEAVVITDKFSGRSKGFGFVTFNDDSAADKAIAEMNGKDMQGRALTVNEARPMEAREDGNGGSRGGFRGGGRGNFHRRERF